MERVWCINAYQGSNTVAIGYDEGLVTIKLGREEPAVSMDSSGKILWAKHSEMQQANLKTIDQATLDAAPGNFFGIFLNWVYKPTFRWRKTHFIRQRYGLVGNLPANNSAFVERSFCRGLWRWRIHCLHCYGFEK